MPDTKVSRREIAAQPILFIRREVVPSGMQPVLAECFGKLYGHGMKAGLAIAGHPMTRYITVGQGMWTIDCIMPLLKEAPAEGEEIQAGFLASGPMAVAMHLGPYEKLPETYVAIESWIKANGYQQSGPAWESYVTDPGEEPDPQKWQTEVFWPIKADA